MTRRAGKTAAEPVVAPTRAERRAAKKAAKRAKKAARPRFTPRQRLVRMGLAALAGVCIFLSFPFSTEPGTNLWPLAWIALVPFLAALQGASGRQGFWIGWWCGLVTNFGGFWWVSEVLHDFGHLPPWVVWPLTVLNAGYQGLSYGIFGLCYARVSKWYVPGEGDAGPATGGVPAERPPIWLIAALFVAVEWLFPLLFPWFLGNGQYRFLPAIQVAELGGVPLVTFVLVAFNAALYALVTWRWRRERLPRRAVLLTFIGVLASLVYGVIRIDQIEDAVAAAPKVKLGLVEANIGIFEKQAKHMKPVDQMRTLQRNLILHQTMSHELEAQGVDLVIWPESSFFPVQYPYIKRSDDFALGVAADGRALGLSYAHGGAAPSWDELAPAPAAPYGPVRAAAAAREDGWALVGDHGALAIGKRVVEVPGKPDLRAVAVIEGAGYEPAQDRASLVVWAVGDHGALVKVGVRGTQSDAPTLAPTATVFATGVDARLNAIAMTSSHEGVAVGDAGAVVEIAQDKATKVTVPTSERLNAVIASGETAAIAVGAHGTLLMRRQAGQWEDKALGHDVELTAIATARNGALYIGGAGGAIFTPAPSDSGWNAMPLPTKADVVALAPDALGQPIALTADGALFRLPSGTTTWQPLPAPPTPVVALAPLGFVSTYPLPRDIHWVWQGDAPLPAVAAYDANPRVEFEGVSDRDLNSIQRGFRTPILLGGLTWEDAPPDDDPDGDGLRMFNTAILLDEQGHVLGTYDKNFLLAFGEFMPLGRLFPVLYKMLPQAGRFTAGNEVRVFDWRGYKLGVMICYEDIMPNFTSKLNALEPNIIINVTNDAWFGHTAEPHHHLALSVFRAIENRLMLVRSTNTGVSAFIDPTGRIIGQTSIDDPETLVRDAPMMPGGSMFGMIGNLFATLCFLAVGLPAGVRIYRRLRARFSPRSRGVDA